MVNRQSARLFCIALSLLPLPLCAQELRPADQFAIAAAHYVDQDWQQAAAEFEKYVQQFPQADQVIDSHFYAAESLVQLQRYEAAYKQYATALKSIDASHRLHRQSLFRQGESAYLAGKLNLARKPLEEFYKTYPNYAFNAFALPYLGEFALRDGNLKVAIQLLEQALQRFPDGALSQKARFGLAQALELQKNPKEARRFYELVANDKQSAVADDALLRIAFTWIAEADYQRGMATLLRLEREFADGDQIWEAQFWLGRTYAKLEQWQSASKAFEQCRSLVARRKADHSSPAEASYRLAMAYYKLKQPGKARVAFHDTAHQFRGSELAERSLAKLGQLAWEQRDPAALKHVVELLTRDFPNSQHLAQFRQLAGRLTLTVGNQDEAEGMLKKLVETDGTAENLYLLALAQHNQNKLDECLATLGRITDASEERKEAITALRASALVAKKDFESAIIPLERIVRAAQTRKSKHFDLLTAQFQLTHAYVVTKRLDLAWNQFKELATHQKDERYLPTCQLLAEGHFKNEQHQRARELFLIISREGNPADFIQHGLSGLAWCDFHLNSRERSMSSFRRLIETYPDSRFTAEAAFVRAQWLSEKGDSAAALPLYRLIIDRHNKSNYVAESLLATARILEEQQLLEEASRMLEQLVEGHPEFERLDSAIYNQAWVLTQLKQGDAAHQAYLRLHKEFPDSSHWADASYRIAARRFNEQDYSGTAQFVEQLSLKKLPPKIRGFTLYLAAQASLHQKDHGKARAQLKQFTGDLELANHSLKSTVSFWYAECAYRLRDYTEAITAFRELSQGTGAEDWRGQVPLRFAQVLAKQGKWQEALDASLSLRKQQESRAEVPAKLAQETNYLVGRSYAMLGRLNDARDAYIRVIEYPTGGRTKLAAMAQWMIGETYFMQKNYELALAAYHRVRVLYPFETWRAAALLQSGKCREVQGKWLEAEQHYSEILTKYPSTKFKSSAKKRLEKVRKKLSVAQGRTPLTNR